MNNLRFTPLVELKNINGNENVNNFIYGKVESENPTGSIKDRTVYQMLLDYQESGKLKPGSTIVEATSGNTGIALSYYSKIFNYKCLIVMPTSMSKQRREMIAQYGASLVLVDGGMKECNEKAEEIIKVVPDSFIFDQFNSKSNAKAHYLSTAVELDQQLKDVDYIFVCIGTGGTISGIGQYYKEHSPKTKIIGIEPYESPLLTKGIASSHLIQGIGANFIPNTYEPKYVDEVITVKGEESILEAKKIREIEKLDIGISSGACYLAAVNYLKSNNINNKKVIVIFPDKGDRYTW